MVKKIKKPILVIMAAGMGSRYGGLKQIEPIDEFGHIIMDFSIYDGKRAGFEKVVFIIKKENEELFKECIGNRVSEHIEVEYVYQELTNLPNGYHVPKGREKPFGTGHAILCCRDIIDGPFVVLNADDYYGVKGFKLIYDYLLANPDSKDESGRTVYSYGMVGYQLGKTLTENGYVSRGVCQLDEEGFLTGIIERTHIEKKDNQIVFTENKGISWENISPDATVSMNLFGFTQSFIKELEERFIRFLDNELALNPLKAEFFLPGVVGELIDEGKAKVKVLNSTDSWYGITYQEDKESVKEAIIRMKNEGLYGQYLLK